jgi:Holliday junction resolvasome RuvABC endonuclease subunit
MTVVAGFDLATTSGAAAMNGDKLIHAEAFRPRGDTDAEIFTGFRVWFRAFLIAHAESGKSVVDAVAIEEPLRTDIFTKQDPDGVEHKFSNMMTYLRLYGLRGHAIQICQALSIDCYEVNQSTWRKAFTGNGRADKEMSLAQCKQLRFDVRQKDAAEAVGVAWWLTGHLRVAHLMRPGELFATTA